MRRREVLAKIMAFQHVPYEPLGTLDPLIRAHKHRIRYVNFGRKPHAKPRIDGYDALIILGGPMNIGQEALFPHLEVEKALIRQAIDHDLPILGICLGAQLIASALGAEVKPACAKEIGWYRLSPTIAGKNDPVISAFEEVEQIFQWHGYSFELPRESELLVTGDPVVNQAFRIKNNVYAFQFHLEASIPLIQRWLNLPEHRLEMGAEAENKMEKIWRETQRFIDASWYLSEAVFGRFLALLPEVNHQHRFKHRHF